MQAASAPTSAAAAGSAAASAAGRGGVLGSSPGSGSDPTSAGRGSAIVGPGGRHPNDAAPSADDARAALRDLGLLGRVMGRRLKAESQ